MLKTGFIGAGTTGTALAVRLSEKGWPVVGVSSRTLSSAQKLARLLPDCRAYHTGQELADIAELVLITTPDDVIAQVCSEVHWRKGQSVLHCSGGHSVDILAPAKKLGAAVGAFHPLQTFADADRAIANLPGSTFALEAEEPLLSTLKELSSLLDGSWVELKPGDKVLYHAAAVFACNYLVTLVQLALDLWKDFGVSSEEATRALLPLLRGTLNNIDNIGLPHCLTGPVARGDSGTIERHLRVLGARNPCLLNAYRELGLQTIPIALAKGKVNQRKTDEMRMLFMRADFGYFHSEEVPMKSGRPRSRARGKSRQSSGHGEDSSPRFIGARNDRKRGRA
jgi:predicted short-subunit dehydrogenase-like oxidoreductase (DUF2520 family)